MQENQKLEKNKNKNKLVGLSHCNPEISIWEKSMLVELSSAGSISRVLALSGGNSGCLMASTLHFKLLVMLSWAMPNLCHQAKENTDLSFVTGIFFSLAQTMTNAICNYDMFKTNC